MKIEKFKVNNETDVDTIQALCLHNIEEAKLLEKDIKKLLKEFTISAKKSRSQLARTIKARKFYQREFRLVNIRFKSKYYLHRKWGVEHPIEALFKGV